MNPSDDPLAPPGSLRQEEDRQRASRRAAILGGLGKGSAALVAMSPLASQAVNVRSHKLANGTLPGGFGYCTISGFQSAAVSGSPAPTVCSAYAPSHYLETAEALTYNVLTGSNTQSVNKNNLADALNTHFSLTAGTITADSVQASLLASPPVKLVVSTSNLVILPLTSNTGTALRGKSFPGSLTNFTALFSSIFGTPSLEARTIMEVLYDGVVSSSPATANCYFMSAYLTVFSGTPSNLPSGFDKTYLTSNYESAGAGSDVYAFLKALCTVA